MRFSLLFCCLFPYAVAHAAPPPGEEKKSRGKERQRSFTGVLALGDARDTVLDQPVKVIPLRATRGSAYVMDLKSDSFDTLLRLENSKGVELARNDNAEAGVTNSRIEFMVPEDDEYHLLVTTATGKVGGFTLTILPLGRPGDPGVSLLDGKLKDDGRGGHSIKVAKNKRYVIDLLILADVKKASLIGQAEKIKVENSGYGGNPRRARVEYLSDAEGVLEVSVSADASAAYVLCIRESRNPNVAHVAGPEAVQLEDELSDDDPRDTKRKGCYAKAFKVKLQAGKTYEINMRAGFDTFLRLENADGKEVAWDDDSGDGNNSRILFPCKADGVYTIRATSFNTATGAFHLSFQERTKK